MNIATWKFDGWKLEVYIPEGMVPFQGAMLNVRGQVTLKICLMYENVGCLIMSK